MTAKLAISNFRARGFAADINIVSDDIAKLTRMCESALAAISVQFHPKVLSGEAERFQPSCGRYTVTAGNSRRMRRAWISRREIRPLREAARTRRPVIKKPEITKKRRHP